MEEEGCSLAKRPDKELSMRGGTEGATPESLRLRRL